MFKKTALIAGISLALSATAQADYRWEAGVDISGNDNDSVSVDGTFYLNPVDTSKGPYAEAAFLDHSSYVTANYTDGELDGDIINDLEYKNYGASGRYITDSAGWILDLGYQRNEPDNPLAKILGPDNFEIDQFSIAGGKYLTDNTTLVGRYIYAEGDDGADFDRYTLELEHLFQLSWGGIKVDAVYGLVDLDGRDDIDIYKLGGTYYLNNNLGFGASYAKTDELLDEIEAYSVFAEWFITEQVAASLEYTDAELDDSDISADTIVFGVRARF